METTDIWEKLAKALPGFEKRADQIAMANAVSDALLTKEHLICEAGTGIGKSFAYLLPIIQFVKSERAGTSPAPTSFGVKC